MSEHLELQRLADLSDEELAEVYAPPAEPWFRVNFVSTADGAAQGSDGVTKSINNAPDKRVFDALRARADCLVVGAGTLRAEAYKVPRLPLVVVSRSAGVPPTLGDAPRGRILMATVASAGGLAAAREQLGEENVLVLGEDEVDLVELRTTLAERGWAEQLCEGGPALFADLLAAGVVDELCWTVVPTLTGGEALRMTRGAEVEVALRPVLLLEQDGTLLGRWLVERPD
ncbi:dihydrofolate reductase family protein [Nocardioides astragali]|uniref:Dihydrofolate reductase family protein n=1 Tax=Nocardioides astragali TaxID=1776736 RepID=A0ABW2N5N5_9ACTN|nr:dihydrofolate reductase family protein [Nocardioides astragali]